MELLLNTWHTPFDIYGRIGKKRAYMSKKTCLNLKHKINDVYFCPFCRVVSENPEDFKPQIVSNRYRYRCPNKNCGKVFDQKQYEKLELNGEHYFSNDYEKIEKIIIHFYQQGCSYRDIAQLTHFSRRRIGEIIKSKVKTRELTYIEFYENILGEDFEYIDIYTQKSIVKMLEFGLSKRNIMEITKITYYSLQRLLGDYSDDIIKKHRVKIKNKKIIYSYIG